MVSDLKFILFWWLNLLLLGCISLPLIFLIFNKFWDKGYIFSKILSASLLTYLIYILGFFKFVPFTQTTIFVLLILALSLDYYFLWVKGHLNDFLSSLKSNYLIFLGEELVFLLILILWSWVRGFAPDIEGLEKFMDWGFVNSALRSQFMPPSDMWFAGEPINYYYFGHLIFAVLTKLSGISSAITYNLAIATVCALTFVCGFSLTTNMVFTHIKKVGRQLIVAGLISALLLTFGGNLHTVYKIAKINIQNEGKLTLTWDAISRAAQSYWYPDATRFIGYDPDTNDKTIHEFPMYSFVVADLHGHMNDIPIVIFFLAFLFSLSLVGFKSGLNWQLIIPSGLILSWMFMTNAWDFAVYGLLFAIFYLIHKSSLVATVFHGLLIVVCWYLFSLPFVLNFTPMAEGLKLVDVRSPLYQLFVLYGGFWLIVLPFVVFLVPKIIKSLGHRSKNINQADVFAFALIVTATILVIIPEIIYIKDIYIYEHRRSNTMFKLVYEAFMMYALVSGYVLVRLQQFFKSQNLRIAYKIIFVLIFASHLVYPYFAIRSYYGLDRYKGLWGLKFLADSYPDNLAAIEWINKNIPGQPLMLEAVGDSYTTFNQVSMATGLPTIEGWVVHEWLWRGGYDRPGARSDEVQKIYESEDEKEVQGLLQKYSVDYIFVGAKEYEKYKDLNEKNFDKLGARIVFTSGQTKIYRLAK